MPEPLTQIMLSEEMLDPRSSVPWDTDSNGNTIGYDPVATVKLEPDQLAQRYGITFQAAEDDLGPGLVAFLETGSGDRFLFVRHLQAPVPGTDLLARVSSLEKYDVCERILRDLGIADEEVAWRRSWPTTDAEEWAGGSRANDSSADAAE